MGDKLPVEIWSKILAYLPVHDRLECCLVCKKFIAAYEYLPRKIKDETVVVFLTSIPTETMRVFKSPSRTFTNLVIDSLDDTSLMFLAESKDFTSKVLSLTVKLRDPSYIQWDVMVLVGNQLESFSLVNLQSKNTEEEEEDVLNPRNMVIPSCTINCTRVNFRESWYFKANPEEIPYYIRRTFSSRQNVDMRPYLMRLKHIRFTNYQPRPWEVMEMMPSLTSIEWEGCHCNNKLLKAIRKLKTNLNYLAIKNCHVEDTFFDELATYDLKLRKLNLDSCSAGSWFIVKFLKTQKDLEALNLGQQTLLFSINSAVEVFKQMTKVTQLSLEAVSMRGFDSCFGHMRLRNLNLSSADILSSEVLAALSLRNFDLKSLKMDKFYSQKENLVKMFPLVPNLVELDLNYSDEEVDDGVMWEISHHLRKLKVLKVGNCKKITDEGFIGYSASTGISNLNLDELHANGCRISDKSCIQGFNFRHLTTLDLTNCQRITNEGLIAVAFNNPTIQVLKFNDTLLHLQEVTKILKLLSRLRVLEMHHGLKKKELFHRELDLKTICRGIKFSYVFDRSLYGLAVM